MKASSNAVCSMKKAKRAEIDRDNDLGTGVPLQCSKYHSTQLVVTRW